MATDLGDLALHLGGIFHDPRLFCKLSVVAVQKSSRVRTSNTMARDHIRLSGTPWLKLGKPSRTLIYGVAGQVLNIKLIWRT